LKEKKQILSKFLKKIFIPKTGSSIFRWVVTFIFSVVLFFAVVTVAVVAVLRDGEVQIPQRFASKIISQINSLSSANFIQANRIYLSLDDSFEPEITISNVDFLYSEKEPFLSFNSLKTKFSLVDLVFGKFRVTSVNLDSANLSIIRKNNGSLDFDFGAENISKTEFFDTLSFLKKLDEYFVIDEMERFQHLNLFGLTAQVEDQLTGKIFTVDGARFRLKREEQALVMGFDLALLSGGEGVATIEANFKSTIGQIKGEFGILLNDFSAQDIANLSPEFRWLSVLEAPISGALRGSLNKDGKLNPVNTTLQIGSGLIKPSNDIEAVAFNSARAYFSYAPGSGEINFDEIFIDSKDLKATADGFLIIENIEDVPETFVTQLNFTDLQTGGFGLLNNRISSNSASTTFRVQLDPFDLEIAQFYVYDQNSEIGTHTDGFVSVKDDNWVVSLETRSGSADLEEVLYFWPKKNINQK